MPNERRPKTYTRKFNASAEPCRAVGKYFDETDCKVKPCRFNVGSGEDAEKRLATIQYIYENGGRGKNGNWLEGLRKVALQVAAGETPTLWTAATNPEDYAKRVLGSRDLFPALKIVEPDPVLMAESVKANEKYVDEAINKLRLELESTYALQASNKKIPAKLSKHKLKSTLEAFKKDRVEKYKGKYQGKVRVGKQIDDLISVADDCLIHDFGTNEIMKIVDHYANRPKTKVSDAASKTYCENQITELYKFCGWLELNFSWKCPNLKAIDRRVVKLATDTLNNAINNDRHWQPDELRQLFLSANSTAKLIIALGLNTGSGAAELGRMRVDQFVFDKPHPYAKLIKCELVGSWYIGTRQKQFTHSEAFLWPWVAELVKRQVEICKKSEWPYLFTQNGEPMYLDNEMYSEVGLPEPNTSKPESRFITCYTNAITATNLSRKLSLGKLRKTLSNYLTMEAHEDLASLLLSHKTKDDLLGNYANRPFGRLHKAIHEAEEYWNLTVNSKS